MKIAHVGTSITLNQVVLNQMSYLAQQGHQVTAICTDDEWAKPMKDLGIGVIPVPFIRHNAVATLRAGAETWNICRAERFDVLHTHNTPPGVVGRIAGRLAGAPAVIHTCHAWPLHQRRNWAFRNTVRGLEKLAGLAANAVLFQNADDMRACLKLGVLPAAKATLIGNGIDIERFRLAVSPDARARVRDEMGIDEDDFVVVCVARLEPLKGHRFLLDGLNELVGSSRSRRVRALLVGDGASRRDLEAHAGRLGLEEAVRFTGYRHDAHDLIAASDASVLASSFEGVPRALMESMVLGLPVVATDVPGTRSLVVHERTGFLAPYGDPRALAVHLQKLADEPDLARNLGDAGKRLVEARFDERQVYQRIIQVYDHVLGHSGAELPRWDVEVEV